METTPKGTGKVNTGDPVVHQPGACQRVLAVRENLGFLQKTMKNVMHDHVLNNSVPITALQEQYSKGKAAVKRVIHEGDIPEDDQVLSEVKSLLCSYHDIIDRHQKEVETQKKNSNGT